MDYLYPSSEDNLIMLIYANPAEQFKSYQSEIESAVLSVMRGNSYILGKEVSAFEKEFATYIGTNSAKAF